MDPDADCVLLVDHIEAGIWLPSAGHVEPGEHSITTVHREVREELSVDAEFLPKTGDQPVFITMTETAPVADRRTHVSLWFALRGRLGQHLSPNPGEFHGVRWWTRNEIADADPETLDPHLARMLGKFDERV